MKRKIISFENYTEETEMVFNDLYKAVKKGLLEKEMLAIVITGNDILLYNEGDREQT